jgi:hypothetical protein
MATQQNNIDSTTAQIDVAVLTTTKFAALHDGLKDLPLMERQILRRTR